MVRWKSWGSRHAGALAKGLLLPGSSHGYCCASSRDTAHTLVGQASSAEKCALLGSARFIQKFRCSVDSEEFHGAEESQRMLNIFSKIPELRRRLGFTLVMLAVYRLGVFVSTPGIDVDKLRQQFASDGGALFGLVNMFSGGALENFSIFTLGISPYISVSIIIQLLSPAVPMLEALRREGAAGRRVLTRYTRWGTLVLAIIQGLAIAVGLENQELVLSPGWTFRLNTAITLCAGTMFIMWLGEQITERGIGNGTSIIIFAGIVARMPSVLVGTVALAQSGAVPPSSVLVLLAFSMVTVAGIVYVERCQRKIPVQYPRRTVNNRVTQPVTQFMPLKINMASVIPPIFASALLVIPTYVLGFSSSEKVRDLINLLAPGSWVYELVFAVFYNPLQLFLYLNSL